MNKQQLASKIWESANKMRSKIEANEYKDYILGFIFYKYLSEKQIKWLKENDFTDEDIKALSEDDTETREYIQKNVGYFIAYDHLYSTWLAKGKDFDVSDVTDALSAFSRLISPTHKKVFENIFKTLETGLSKLGESSGARTKAISGLLQLIKDIPMDGRQDYDVLGFIYEYLISMFAANAGKKAGEFYTPHEVSKLMSEIVANYLKERSEIKIYDPTSGSGSLLINIGHSIARYINDNDNIKYYAQELKENTYNLTRMNLVMRGIKPDNIVTRNGDTIEEDWPYFDENDPIHTYDPLYVDAVVSNPPYSQSWDPTNKESDARYARYGLAPKSKADYAFLLHDLYHLKRDGIMTIVLPHGVLFRGGDEGQIRKNLIENNNIDAIIGLPANIFFGTGIPTIIIVLKQQRPNTDVLFIEASKGFIKEGKNNKLRACDIKKIVDTIIERKTVEKFSRVVSREEIRENEYNLNIPRYVDSSEPTETWDIYASMFGGIPKHELNLLDSYWKAFPTLQKSLFTDNGSPYVALATEDIKETIKGHEDIKKFKQAFADAFASFENLLISHLLDQVETVNIPHEKEVISKDIFNRLAPIPLINPYEAYQTLDDQWASISIDLEILQSEGFAAAKKVDPNLVYKKKNGTEQEVQDGWVGRVLPFELVQETILHEELQALENKNERILEIDSEIEEIADSLSEEDKEGAFFDDGKFVTKELTNAIKNLSSKIEEEKELKASLKKVQDLLKEEKALKAEIKKDSADLITLTKETIENLSNEQVYELLHQKWLSSLLDQLHKLPDTIVTTLVKQIEALNKKYETTLSDIEKEIQETEAELCAMIDELEGDDFDMKGLYEFKALLGGK